MSHEPIEPLDPALSALLDAERSVEPTREELGRVWSRIAAVPVAGSNGDGGTSSGGGAGGAAQQTWLASHVTGAVAVAFAVGAATGAAGYAAVATKDPAERVVYVDRVVAAAVAPATSASASTASTRTTTTTAAPTPTPIPIATSTSTEPPTGAPTLPSLSAEHALVDGARRDLAAGDARSAITLLEEHARRFTKAQLAEEREALVIQSLVALGRYDDARAAAARFRAASPASLFMPAIEASLGSIP